MIITPKLRLEPFFIECNDKSNIIIIYYPVRGLKGQWTNFHHRWPIRFVHNTSDIVLNFQVKKPKTNLFMNEKPQNLKIAINSLKLNETFWKIFCSSTVHRSIYVKNYIPLRWLFLKLQRNNYARYWRRNVIS